MAIAGCHVGKLHRETRNMIDLVRHIVPAALAETLQYVLCTLASYFEYPVTEYDGAGRQYFYKAS